MFEDIDKAIDDLASRTAGYVTRRDAADALCDAASRAIRTLRGHEMDSDVDVRSAVERALGQIGGALMGIEPQAGVRSYTLEELARACEKTDKRTVTQDGDDYVIDVVLTDGRKQVVRLSPMKRKDGTELIRALTICGKPTEESLKWSLKTNMKITHGALALHKDGGEDQLVLMNCFMADATSPGEIKSSVKELAFYGDWIEQKLSGLDDF